LVFDAEGNAGIGIRADTLPAWLSLIDHTGGAATLRGGPSDADVGNYPVLLVARDAAGVETVQQFEINVLASSGALAETVRFRLMATKLLDGQA
jgi:hypothetical protein